MTRALTLSLCAIVAHCLHTERTFNLQPPTAKGSTSLFYPRTGVVDLDLEPPAMRWKAIMQTYRDEMIPYFTEWQHILNSHTEIDQAAWTTAVTKKLKPEYMGELEGILEALNSTEVTWSNLILFQVMYELGSPMACSEVLAANDQGVVLHGRNLDYRVISPVIEITFIKNKQRLLVTPTYLGLIGIHTGMKFTQPKSDTTLGKNMGWSFGQNTRGVSGDTTASALFQFQNNAQLFIIYVRELMERDYSYNEVLQYLQAVPVAKDMYFIIAGSGPYQGAVLARAADPSKTHVNVLSVQTPNSWFLFQTNDDLGSTPNDNRRQSGINSMTSLTQAKLSPIEIVEVMRKPPVYTAGNVVLFTMAPKSGQFCSVLGPLIHNDDTSVDVNRCSMPGWDHYVAH